MILPYPVSEYTAQYLDRAIVVISLDVVVKQLESKSVMSVTDTDRSVEIPTIEDMPDGNYTLDFTYNRRDNTFNVSLWKSSDLLSSDLLFARYWPIQKAESSEGIEAILSKGLELLSSVYASSKRNLIRIIAYSPLAFTSHEEVIL